MQYYGSARLINPQTVSYTATAGATTNVVGPQVNRVRIETTTDAFVLNVDGPAFTAVTTSSGHFWPAGSVEYITVSPGQKISIIRSTADGTAYISEAV